MKKVVVITGGTSGIGFATAKKFLSRDYRVVVVSNDPKEKVDAAMEELSKLGEVLFCPCNITSREECENAITTAAEKFGQVDVLANVAGITGKRQPFLDGDLDDTMKVININLMGSLNMALYAAREMVKRHTGVIINVGSICGLMANSEAIGYHASKGAIKMVTQALAKELTPQGLRVLSVAPGWVDTGLMDQKAKEYGGKLHMKGRVVSPEEIADVIYLMSLDEAAAINGTTVSADDGYTAFKGVNMKPQILAD